MLSSARIHINVAVMLGEGIQRQEHIGEAAIEAFAIGLGCKEWSRRAQYKRCEQKKNKMKKH